MSIDTILLQLGINPVHSGYDMIKFILENYTYAELKSFRFTGHCGIYEDAGKNFGTDWKNAERRIRFAIKNATCNNITEILTGFKRSDNHITNKEFLIMLKMKLKSEERYCGK